VIIRFRLFHNLIFLVEKDLFCHLLVLIFWVYFLISVIPESGCRKEPVTEPRTLLLIKGQMSMGAMEEIPMITGQQDFLTIISMKAIGINQ